MHFDVALALVVFCFVASVTPGPNNMMLLSSAVNFGVRRTLPHLLGVVLGFSAMVGLVGFGLDALFDRFPSLLPLMRWAGAAYLLWLAWRVANAGPAHEAAAEGRPLGFFAAAAFQWINPKAWVAGIGALTAYSVSDDYTTSVIAVTLAFAATGILSASSWVLFGAGMRRVLSDPGRVRPFNWTMAALLAASVAPIFWE